MFGLSSMRMLDNFWYKIAAVILAVFIWVMVQSEETVELNRRVKVVIEVPENLMIVGGPIRYVSAIIKSPRVSMGEILNKQLEARIVIPNATVGEVEISVHEDHIKNIDSRIKMNIINSIFNIYVDEKSSRAVNIREILQGAPADGFMIERVALKPERVTITGSKSEIERIREVITESIDITGIYQSKSFDVNLIIPGTEGVQLSTETVHVMIQVGNSKVNKRFSNVLVEIVGQKPNLGSVSPKVVSILLQGTPSVLNYVTKRDLRAFVEMTETATGQYEKEVKVKIPPDSSLIETFPERVTLEVGFDSASTDVNPSNNQNNKK